MPRYYDDNFGEWEINDEDDLETYREFQNRNVEKKCEGCGRTVKIQPQYAYCNSCANKLEKGWDI